MGDSNSSYSLEKKEEEGKKEKNNSIKVYARFRPVKNFSSSIQIDYQTSNITIHINKKNKEEIINNIKEDFSFKFTQVFPPDIHQDQIFDIIAKPIALSTIAGYNNTIFAYGQTSSGKTYTMTGDTMVYNNRGIIPRTISFIFEEIEKQKQIKKNVQYYITISYLEIYNNSGYDLLDRQDNARSLFDLPKVQLLEDEDRTAEVRNLSLLPCRTEEDALNLLFIGETNRIVCETPLNDTSTRSHCIFSINLEEREIGASLVKHSKLHLVDLAGSERVGKTQIEGEIFKEAVNINLSLFFLQMVISALDEKMKYPNRNVHVPYRNSLMTFILRDSLGGNCQTAMIATLNPESTHIAESLETCRFGNRVRQITNTSYINQSIDPQLLIKQLKNTIHELRAEISLLKGQTIIRGPLTFEEKEECNNIVSNFISLSNDINEDNMTIRDMKKICHIFSLMKQKIVSSPPNSSSIHPLSHSSQNPTPSNSYQLSIDPEEKTQLVNTVKKLNQHLKARDNEIKLLVSLLQTHQKQNNTQPQNNTNQNSSKNININQKNLIHDIVPSHLPRPTTAETKNDINQLLSSQNVINRSTAFESFRKSYRKNQALDLSTQELKNKIEYAQKLGQDLNEIRSIMNQRKAEIERLRLDKALFLQGLTSSNRNYDNEEKTLFQHISETKENFNQKYNQLQKLRSEIPHLKHLVETGRMQLQQDYDKWLNQTNLCSKPASTSSLSLPIPSSTGNIEADEDIKAFYSKLDILKSKTTPPSSINHGL